LDLNGHIIDDMIFAVCSESEVLGVPNSTMVAIVMDWLSGLLPGDESIMIEDISKQNSIIALQGPLSEKVIGDVLGESNAVGRFNCQEIVANSYDISGWIQGTGYTGEKGFEIFIPNEQSSKIWDLLISHSSVVPVGLGARDTLRLEKGYLLSGQDFLWPGIAEERPGLPDGFLARTTWETSVPFGLELTHDFIGREALIESTDGRTRLWGIKCLDRGPSPRPGHRVFSSQDGDSEIVGFVTSGGPSPSLGMSGIAMGYLENCEEGQEVWVQTSSRRRVRSEVLRTPFV
jgi:aminomethyltransferase